MDYDAIIVGCGHNGLVAAHYLAAGRLRVLALEQQDKVGGLCITDELFPGYQVSTYPHNFGLFHPQILADMRLVEHGVETFRGDPSSFHPFLSGSHLLFWRDLDATLESIGRISAHDAAAYPRWLELSARSAAMFAPFLLTEPPSLGELAQRFEGTDDEELFYRLLTGTARGLADELFESEEVKISVSSTLDSGSTDAPGALLYWAFHNAVTGLMSATGSGGYPRGGMGAVTQAMQRSVEAAGVEVRTSAPVDRILVRDGVAVGVRLGDGTEVSARAVLSNADPKRTFLRLVGPEALAADFVASVQRLHAHAGYIKLHCATHALPDWNVLPGEGPLDHHYAQTRMVDSLDTIDHSWAYARTGRLPNDFLMGMISTTLHDPSSAPPGHYVLTIWAEYGPVRLREGTWEDAGRLLTERIINRVAAHAPNFPDIIDDTYLVTSHEIEDRFGLIDGSMHHIDMTPDQMLSRRPLPGWSNYRTPVDHLYLCGSGCHPGGGVTGTPGHNAAMAVLHDWKQS